jgi:hypothetical protein
MANSVYTKFVVHEVRVFVIAMLRVLLAAALLLFSSPIARGCKLDESTDAYNQIPNGREYT